VISVDTDGRPHDIIPPMTAAGVNYLYPLEVAAGCDVVEMQRLFPDLRMMGGIAKRALAAGSEPIDVELQRIRPDGACPRRAMIDVLHSLGTPSPPAPTGLAPVER